MKLKLLAGAYVSFLILVVVLADAHAFQPFFSLVRRVPLGDKFGHFFLMGFLSLVVNLSLGCRVYRVFGGRARVLKGSAVVLFVVALEEVSQLFFRHRSFDVLDLTFDCLGIIFFGWVARHLTKRRDFQRAAS